MATVGESNKKVTAISSNTPWDGSKTAGKPAGYSEYLENIPQSSSGSTSGKSFGDFARGANSFLGEMNVGAKGGDILAGIPDMFGAVDKYGSFSEDEKSAQSAIRNGLAMIPGYGQLIALATGAVDAIGSATGLNLSSVDKDTANRAGVKGTEFNKIMNMLPGNSMIWGGISAAFGNKRTQSLNVSGEVLGMSDGFSGAIKDIEAAKNLGNKRLFFGQTDQANNFIDSQKRTAATLEKINTVNTQRKQSDYYQDLQNQNINRYAGQNYLNTHVGKNGMKLMSVEEARRIVALRKVENPEKFQSGGNLPGISESLIAEGARHKNLNHLAEVNPELEDVTKKGIPVTESTDNQQVAEIEAGEIIFRLEITQKLEELMKDGSEEAMIEAGRICAEEIIEHTIDNTGETIENGDTSSDNK